MTRHKRAVQSGSIIDVISHSPAQTMRIGQRLGALLQPGDLLLLYGSFGAGKTHLTKGIAAGLGVAEADVTSPTFVLINEYAAASPAHGSFPIYHVDLYRLEGTESDLDSIGLRECWEGHGLCVIEWAERATEMLPEERLDVFLDYLSESKRTLRFEPHGQRALEIVAQLKERAFA